MSTSATRERSGRLIVVLGGLSALSPFATDMYAPGFPQLVTAFQTSGAAVQLSLTACLLGLATGQLVLGPLSDALGRRRLLLVGSGAFTLLSLSCALATSIVAFELARLLQGLAGGAGLVIGRAVICDRYTGAAAAARYSTLSVIAMSAPVLAPVTGGLILGVGSWRLVFVALTLAGLVVSVGVWAWVPESLPAARRRAGGPRAVLAAMAGLLRRRELVGHLLVMGCGMAALFAYITGSPFVFQHVYDLTPTGFGLVFATNAVGTVAAGGLFGQLAKRMRVDTLLVLGVVVAVLATAALTALLTAGVSTLATTWACFFGLTFGFGLLLPAATTSILALGDDAPGAASGLLGGGQFVLGATAAPLPGLLGGSTAGSTAGVVLAFLLLSATAWTTLARPSRSAHRSR